MQLQQQHSKIPHHARAGQVAIEVDQDVCAHVVEHLRRIEVRDVRNVDETVYQVLAEDEVRVNDFRSSGKGASACAHMPDTLRYAWVYAKMQIFTFSHAYFHTHTHTLSLSLFLNPPPHPHPPKQHDDDAPLPRGQAPRFFNLLLANH